MLGWQGVHLYHSFRNVDHRQSGECPTRAVEEVYFAAAHHADLIDDLEHAVVVVPETALRSWSAEWSSRFEHSREELDAAMDRALPLVTADLASAVHRVDAALGDIEVASRGVLHAAAAGDVARAVDLVDGPVFSQNRADYDDAVESLVTQSRRFFQAQLSSEHRDEMFSVGIAMAAFAAAIGAWGFFLRQIRRGQRRLAAEEERRREVQEELRRAQTMEALGTMAGAIAHDFSNTLAAIAGSAAAARHHITAASPADTSLATIESAAGQAQELVRGLLAFGRRASFRQQPVDLGALVAATTKLVRPVVPETVRMTVAHPDQPGPFVSGDEAQLHQMVMNLVLNARDAMPEGGSLGVRVQECAGPDGTVACLEVSDTGAGMTEEVQSRIFEPFFTTRAKGGTGTGLGLAIVHSVIAGHGGVVKCESKPGLGSVFTVRIPTLRDRTPSTRLQPLDSGASGDRGVVVIAEGHRHVRALLAEAVQSAGYRPAPVATGSALLAACEADHDRIAVIVVDLGIAEPDGLACVRHLRSAAVTTPVVLTVGTTAPGIEADVGELAHVLRKPFAMSEMLTLIDSLSREKVDV